MYRDEIITENAIIKSTTLGIEDHGILTCYIGLEFASCSQGFGGYTFDIFKRQSPNDSGFSREGAAYGMEFINRILRTLEVDSWEKLVGKVIRARHDHNKVHSIGNIIKDNWFDPERDLKYLVEE